MRRIGEVLQQSLTKRLWERARQHEALVARVRGALPEPLGAHCVGAARRDQHLILFADAPLWATRLRFASPALLHRLNEGGAGLKEVRVRVALPLASGGPTLVRPQPPSGAAVRLIEETAASLPAGELRDALRRLAVRATAPQGGRRG